MQNYLFLCFNLLSRIFLWQNFCQNPMWVSKSFEIHITGCKWVMFQYNLLFSSVWHHWGHNQSQKSDSLYKFLNHLCFSQYWSRFATIWNNSCIADYWLIISPKELIFHHQTGFVQAIATYCQSYELNGFYGSIPFISKLNSLLKK